MSITYIEGFLKDDLASQCLKALIKTNDWEHLGPSSRGLKWYGDRDYIYNRYSFPKELMPIYLEYVAGLLNPTPNGVLVNYYPDGRFGIGWHSDDEESLIKGMPISIISLGAERLFRMRRKDKSESKEFLLKNGSLLIMDGNTQDEWQHYIPRDPSIKEPRISLTFRHV